MFSLLHVVCAAWCFVGGRVVEDERIRDSALVSALFYLASPVIDHLVFPHPHSLTYTYFTVFAIYDATWAVVMLKYNRQWAAICMAGFVMMELVAMTSIGKTPHFFSTLLNIVFLGCLFLPNRPLND